MQSGIGSSQAYHDGHPSEEKLQGLSRSPQPYGRKSLDIRQDESKLDGLPQLQVTSTEGTSTSPNQYSKDSSYGGESQGQSSHGSPSDSGTEADDEKGHFLTSLPAPPVRPRKGLREGYGTASPLLTPTYIDEANISPPFENLTNKHGLRGTPSPGAAEEATRIREKFVKRRRAELLRRITETLLSLLLTVTTAASASRSLVFNSSIQPSSFEGPSQEQLKESSPLLIYAICIALLYTLYPLRIISNNHQRNLQRNKPWYYIYFPAAFDPATLLYPTLLPVVTALLIGKHQSSALPINIALGLSSIPSKIIPFSNDVSWYASFHWLISTLPASLPDVLVGTGIAGTGAGTHPDVMEMSPENLTYIYLLHQALVSIIHNLVSSSLLPTEVQLLSTGLINLLLQSRSAQAIILQAILWIGGILTLVLCGQVLQWEVALARIPSWRFQRPKHRRRRKSESTLSDTISDFTKGRFGSLHSTDEAGLSDGSTSLSPNRRYAQKKRQNVSSSLIGASSERETTVPFSIANGSVPEDRGGTEHRRRSTLPSTLGGTAPEISLDIQQVISADKTKATRSLTFRSLTLVQAKLLKWGFAVYVYAVILLIIAFPVRRFVARFALQGQEPIGWALEYLLGGSDLFRNYVTDLDLADWIPLNNEQQNPTVTFDPHNVRLSICVYCLSIIAIGLRIVFRLSSIVEVDTRRKVFHGMMVAMFLPTVYVDPAFISFALMLILAIFLLLDLFRASQLPPISRPLTHFLAPYVDGRDHRGPVVVSHIFLLIGCAIPLWLSLAAVPRSGSSPSQQWDVQSRDPSMISGIVCVGMGDAAASLVGRRYGRRRWPWTGGKSLEGSLAFAVAVVIGLSLGRVWLLLGGWSGDSGDAWITGLVKAAIAACGASLTEAVLTGGNDNVIVPLVLWLLVRVLEM